jgi:hypothetical protein
MLAEYEQAYEMYRYSEELGERRVNLFLTLVTAVLAALLLADEPLVKDDVVSPVAYALLIGLLLMGLMTLARVARRNENSSAYLLMIGSIRDYFHQLDPVGCSYLDFDPTRATTAGVVPTPRYRDFEFRRIAGTAGLADTMLLLNASVCGLVVALLLLDVSRAPVAAVCAGLLAGASAWWLQFRQLNAFYRRNEARRNAAIKPPIRLTERAS